MNTYSVRPSVTVLQRVLVAGVIAITGSVLPAQSSPAPRAPMSGHASADSSQSMLNLVTIVNHDEIAAARLATSRASRADVREYAQHIIDDHSAAMQKWAEKAPGQSLKVPDSIATSSTTPVSGMVGSAAMNKGMSEVRDTTTRMLGGLAGAAIHSANLKALSEMQKANGAAFDALYLDAEIKGHQSVLKALDQNPITNMELQPLQVQFRNSVAQHLSAARKLKDG